MDEDKDRMEGVGQSEREEIFSKSVRAGKRTYFFDVKSTRRNDYYLTITESKKRFNKDGRFYYEKHKIFLYKEDFDKFFSNLQEAVDFIKTSQPAEVEENPAEFESSTDTLTKEYSDVEFEDLEALTVANENKD